MAEISEDEQIDLLFKKFTNTVNANPVLPFSNTQNRSFPFQNFEFSKNLFIDNIPENLDNITYNGLLGSAALDASFGAVTDISYEIPNYPLLYYHRIELTNALDGLNNTSWYYPDPNNNKLSLLRGSIPFNYDPINFTYKQLLYSNSNQEEALNSDPLYWLFDYKSGFVQFYGDPVTVTTWVNTNGPPRLSVIVYNGNKGLENFLNGSGVLNDINTLQGDVTTLQGNVTTLQGDVTTLQGNVTTLQGNVTTLQGNVTTLQGDVTTLQGDVTTLQGDVTTLQGNVTTLQGDITTLQGNITTLQGNITTLQGDVATLQGDGDIKGDNLFLGNEGTTPKIDLFFKNGVASHDIYKYRIEIGKSDDFINSPVFPPNDAYGMNVQANSDGLFVGIETYDSGSNWRPLLKWGDDSTDTPFTIHSKAGNHKWEFRTDGTFSAQSFAPTYSTIPNLVGKIGQAVDAANSAVTLVVNNSIQVRSLTIPYTGVWLISMALYLVIASYLPGDIIYPIDIRVNGGTVQGFYGTNLTGVNGTITLYLNVNDVVSFNAYLSGSGSTGMTSSQRAVWGTGYTFLKAIRIA